MRNRSCFWCSWVFFVVLFMIVPTSMSSGGEDDTFDIIQGDQKQHGHHHHHHRTKNWAVLVAGSNGYWNYRHQADLCHAYQLLRSQGGIPESNIITIMYDDVAHDPKNPIPGTLFNKPSYLREGRDVYEGCKVDYRQELVTPETFLNVLVGNSSTTLPKVLKSTKHDRVFVTFIDHGAPGILAFPKANLHAMDLIHALGQMVYKELVLYVEACESASMFENLLPHHLKKNTYIVTASNSHESSWAWHCPPFDMVGNRFLGTCLADLFSINWIQDAEQHNMSSETLWHQFRRVRFQTRQSHVTEFGDESFAKKATVSEFLSVAGEDVSADDKADVDEDGEFTLNEDETNQCDGAGFHPFAQGVNSRDAALVQKFYAYLRSEDQDQKQKQDHAQALLEEILHRERVDDVVLKLTTMLMEEDELSILREPLALHNFPCHKEANRAFETNCGAHTDYSLKYVRTLVNLCEVLHDTPRIIDAIKSICPITNEAGVSYKRFY